MTRFIDALIILPILVLLTKGIVQRGALALLLLLLVSPIIVTLSLLYAVGALK